jgi:DNA-binding response OmpR family regulator
MNSTVSVQSAAGVRATKLALVVDDVDDMLDLLEIALDAAGFAVLRASSFAEALEVFETRAPEIDLLMTDIRVGTESGLELAGRLRAVKPSLQVLAISGFVLDGKAISPRSKIEFLPKPFSRSELRKKLDSIFTLEPPGVTVTVTGDATGKFRVSATCSAPHRRVEPGPEE